MLDPKQKYLQIALNSTLQEARSIISQIPLDKRIIIEAGTPLIKTYGWKGIREIRNLWESRVFYSLKTSEISLQKQKEKIFKKEIPLHPYIVADLKCMDRGATEVELAKRGGASAAVVLGQSPPETINAFIDECERQKIDAFIDMMNVEFSLNILRQLKKLPKVVVLHRGVDEESFNPESEIPFHEITRIKGEYDIMVAVAGGDTIQEVQRAIFNDADIVVVWKGFYKSTAETAKIAEEFLKEIK